MLCVIEISNSKTKVFCYFVYAANTGRERRELWRNLIRYKSLINEDPWVLMGDWNVSLTTDDHSEGGSNMTPDMIEFQECLDAIEVEDMNSSGIHFTWIQSRLNLSNGILKKIDRVLCNISFLDKFNNSNAVCSYLTLHLIIALLCLFYLIQ